MGSTPASELHAFHVFITEKLANGSAHLSPEEALDAWRDLYPDPFDDEDDVAAIDARGNVSCAGAICPGRRPKFQNSSSQ